MKRLTALVVAPVLAWGFSLATSAQTTEPVSRPAAPAATAAAPPAAPAHYTAEQVERGRYLVEQVDARHLKDPPICQSNSRQLTPPQTSRIQRQNVIPNLQAKC